LGASVFRQWARFGRGASEKIHMGENLNIMAYEEGKSTLATQFPGESRTRSIMMTLHSDARLNKGVRGGPLRPHYILAFLMLFCPLTTWAGRQMAAQGMCQTPLIATIQKRASAEAKKLIDSGVDLNAKDCNGTTALIESIALDQFEISEKLVLAGASLKVVDNKQTSPLMIASWYCRQETVPLLLAHGADVNAVDEHGYSALIDSTQNCQDGRIPALLLRSGAKVNLTTKRGDTALIVASFYGSEQVVHVLLAAGADIAAKTENGETALTVARDRDVGRKESHDRIYQFLLTATTLEKSRPVAHP